MQYLFSVKLTDGSQSIEAILAGDNATLFFDKTEPCNLHENMELRKIVSFCFVLFYFGLVWFM